MARNILEEDPITGYEHLYGDADNPESISVFSDPLAIYSYPDVPRVVPIITIYEHFHVKDYSQENLLDRYPHVDENGLNEALEFIENNKNDLEGVNWQSIARFLGSQADE